MNPTDTSYEVSDFQVDVIEASRAVPVLVDFWAPWCGPCRALGPVLAKLADEQADRWKLVKVNTDAHPQISAQFQIRGIPAVKLFVDGRVVDAFTGALPEQAVRQWLGKAIPTESKRRVEQAQAALAAGSTEEARTLLELALREEPDNPQARLLLARILVFEDPERAEKLAEGAAFAGAGFAQVEEAVKTVARLMRLQDQPEQLPDGPARNTYLQAVRMLAAHDFDTALAGFIEVVRTDRYYDDDGARKACVALFTLLSEQHPATRKQRRTFDMALY